MKINSNDLFFAALYLWLGINITQAITDLDVLTSAIITTIALVSMAVYHYAKDRFNIGQDVFFEQIDKLEKQIETQNSQIAEQKMIGASQAQNFVSQIANAEEQNEILQAQIKNLLLQIETQNEVNVSLQSEIETAYAEKHELAKMLNLHQEEIFELKSDAQKLEQVNERVLRLGWSLERFNDFVFDDYDEKKRKVTLSKIIQTSNAKIRT